MLATRILRNEHRVIEQVLSCLEVQSDRCDRGIVPEEARARQIVSFLRQFADRCHHGKEEDQLFPMMEARGFSVQQGPTAVMRQEHEQGRELIRRIEVAIEGSGSSADCRRDFVIAARGYTQLLRQHIQKEDHCLFPMAEQSFGESERAELMQRFERFEREDPEPESPQKLRGLADDLADHFGVPRARLEDSGPDLTKSSS